MSAVKEKINAALAAFPSHGATEGLKREIDSLAEDELAYFAKLMDESEHSLEEWLNAMIAFNLWLEREKRTLDFFAKADYLHCCAEGGQQSSGLLSLTDLFHDYVKLYGVN